MFSNLKDRQQQAAYSTVCIPESVIRYVAGESFAT